MSVCTFLRVTTAATTMRVAVTSTTAVGVGMAGKQEETKHVDHQPDDAYDDE